MLSVPLIPLSEALILVMHVCSQVHAASPEQPYGGWVNRNA